MPKRKKLLTFMLQYVKYRDFSLAHTKPSLGHPKNQPKTATHPDKNKNKITKICFDFTN